MESANVFIFDTPEQLAQAAAVRFVQDAKEAVINHNSFSVALAGGNTPRRVYELLATDTFKSQIDWARVQLFFGDERCVPPNHPESNYRMVYETLISKISIPVENVHRMPGERKPDEGARFYEDELKSFFAGLAWPRFNLALLGLGEDGHTASLFPDSEALNQKSNWVVATKAPRLRQTRITLTIPVFNHAAHVVFLVTGKEKASVLSEVLRASSGMKQLPAQMIRPSSGSLEWLVDRAAASQLE